MSPVFACVLPSPLFVLPFSVRTAWIVWRGKEVNLLGNRRIDSLDTEEKVNYAALCRTIYESLVSPSKDRTCVTIKVLFVRVNDEEVSFDVS